MKKLTEIYLMVCRNCVISPAAPNKIQIKVGKTKDVFERASNVGGQIGGKGAPLFSVEIWTSDDTLKENQYEDLIRKYLSDYDPRCTPNIGTEIVYVPEDILKNGEVFKTIKNKLNEDPRIKAKIHVKFTSAVKRLLGIMISHFLDKDLSIESQIKRISKFEATWEKTYKNYPKRVKIHTRIKSSIVSLSPKKKQKRKLEALTKTGDKIVYKEKSKTISCIIIDASKNLVQAVDKNKYGEDILSLSGFCQKHSPSSRLSSEGFRFFFRPGSTKSLYYEISI